MPIPPNLFSQLYLSLSRPVSAYLSTRGTKSQRGAKALIAVLGVIGVGVFYKIEKEYVMI